MIINQLLNETLQMNQYQFKNFSWRWKKNIKKIFLARKKLFLVHSECGKFCHVCSLIYKRMKKNDWENFLNELLIFVKLTVLIFLSLLCPRIEFIANIYEFSRWIFTACPWRSAVNFLETTPNFLLEVNSTFF